MLILTFIILSISFIPFYFMHMAVNDPIRYWAFLEWLKGMLLDLEEEEENDK